jgi:hypothetical protein
MLRFEGEVFLLGTAIPAPAQNNKNCDDLRRFSLGNPNGGGRIVANRGPYSERRGKRKPLKSVAPYR